MPVIASTFRAPAWEWAQAALLAANLAWTTLCLGGYRAETMVVTSVLTGVLVAVHCAARMSAGRSRHDDSASEGPGVRVGNRQRLHPAGWLLVPFVLYAAANALWVTPVPWLGWRDWFGWAQMIAVFWVAVNGLRSRGPRAAVFLTLVAVAVVAVFMASYQRFVDSSWLMLGREQAKLYFGRASGAFGSPNSLAALLLLVLPASGALTFRRGAGATERVGWGWVTAVLLWGLVLTISRGAWIGLALALTAWPLIFGRWSWMRRSLMAGLVLAVIAAAGAGLYRASPKVRERVQTLVRDAGERTRPLLWSAAWRLFREQPLTGSGAGSFNVLFERHRPPRFVDEPEWAHNEYLNTLSDYGAAGFVLFFGACGVIVVRCMRREPRSEGRRRVFGLETRETRAGIVIGLLAFALQLFVDFHLKIPALAMAAATLAALVVNRAWPMRAEDTKPSTPAWRSVRPAGYGIALVGAMAGAWLMARWYSGEAARSRGREIIDRLAVEPVAANEFAARLKAAQAELERAVALAPGNGQAWSDLAYVTALFSRTESGRDAELGKVAEAAAEQALARSRAPYEFWVRRGVARDMQGRWVEAGNDFAEAIERAPGSAWAWYYQAEHFSRRATTIPLAQGSLAFCLRLDPWNVAGHALRQRLATGAGAP